MTLGLVPWLIFRIQITWVLDIFENFNRNNFQKQEVSWEVQFWRHDNTSNVNSMSQISDWRTAKVLSLQRLRQIDICALVQICNYTQKNFAGKDTAGLEFDSANLAERFEKSL